jgi:uncharacterized SAM-binding protein YcdF (DUF218 family)
MPFTAPRRRGSASKRFWLALIAVAGVAAVWRIVTLGHLLYHEDPLQKADVIFALAGARLERVAECGDLYLEGWAPRILLSRDARDGGEMALSERGIPIWSQIDLQRDTLIKLGVPAAAIEAVAEEQNATAMESHVLYEIATARGWRTLIVVTSKLHTARAALAMRRRFKGTDVQIIVRGSRYDPTDVDRWWSTRGTFRFALFESQKMLAYWLGAAD